MEEIFEWIKSIAFFLILSELLFQILPDGKYRKYLKFFTGWILVFLIISPTNRWFGWEEKLVETAEKFMREQQIGEIRERLMMAEEEQFTRLDQEYEALILEQVDALTDKYGYEAVECSAKIALDTAAENFGQITELYLVLRSQDADHVIWIEPVQIEGGQLTSAELPEIRAEVEAMYSLESERLEMKLIE